MNGFHKSNGNDVPQNNLVVMKFGGTSVEDAAAIRRVIRVIASRAHSQRVVVVSALARVTDQLLAAAQAASQGQAEYSTAALAALRLRHLEVSSELLPGEMPDFCKYLDRVVDQLQAAFCAVSAANHLAPAVLDQILGFGEHISSRLVAAALREAGLSAVHVDSAACFVTDSQHTRANPLLDVTRARLRSSILPWLSAGQVPVLGGFIAATAEGVPTTLGRGGSDFSASIVGAALQAGLIEIWTDVDGIMTSDPKICADARRISHLSFDEAAELAHFGAKVLHPGTLLPAMRENIPVHVLNSRNPLGSGTQVIPHVSTGHGVKAITAKRGVAAVEVELANGTDPQALGSVCAAFERHACPVDIISAVNGSISLVVGSTAALPRVSADLRAVANVSWENHKALICLVGENVRRLPGVVSRLFSAVSDLDMRVIWQGGSDRSLSFLVEESSADEAIRRLHTVFFPDRKPPGGARLPSAALCQAGEAWL
jgi:aspartate kinase